MKENAKIFVLTLLSVSFPVCHVFAQSTMDTNQCWAWSSGAGWINCRTDSTNGVVVGEYICSGYGYSPSAGWMHFGNGYPTNGIRYTNDSTNDYGVNHDGKGHLSGYAWCPSFGWINFEWTNSEAASSPKVNLQTGVLTGYAWGGSLGWISLTNYSAYVKTTNFATVADSDVDDDGVPDAWELEVYGSTNGDPAVTHSDSDGVSDYDEYLAGSNPFNDTDYLHMTNAVLGLSGTNFQMAWVCSESRVYRVEKRDDLMDTNGWQDSGLGSIVSTSGTSIAVTLPADATQKYYRVKAVFPPYP